MIDTNIKLIHPCIEYKNSYIGLVTEFVINNEPFIPFPLKMDFKDFAQMIKKLKGYARGENLMPGFVPHSTYWLVDNKEVVAVANLRHRLNEHLLKEGGHIGYGVKPSSRKKGYATILLAGTIKKAKEKGINPILVTCEKDNIASAKVIQKNNGILDDEIFSPAHNEIIQRYWIHTG
jgi:predicted acetyltransferase